MLAAIASVAFACNAAALLRETAMATGGASWSAAGEISAVGRLISSGLRGSAELHDDLRSGRYSVEYTVPVKGTRIEVYDGQRVWVRDISGGVHSYDSWYPRARAITEAYITRRAYLDPRAGVTVACVGLATSGSDRTAQLRVEPRGGIPAVLAIDTRTHLLTSIAVRTPTSTDVTTFGDYRQVGPLVLPFMISSASAFEAANADRVEVTRYFVTPTVLAAHFQKPPALESARMLGAAASTTVPIMLEGRQLLVWASINGHAPMPFILDSGGHAILDSVAVRSLGLRATGTGVSGGAGAGTIALQYTRVSSVRIGSAELLDQPFLVIPYPYNFYERGRREPLAGILGLEWFERYATRIDYVGRSLTLTPLARFAYRGAGTPVPIRFQEDMPLARAAADGHTGVFGVDTGDAAVLILYGDFLRRTGLLARYAPGYIAPGAGTGGAMTGRIETLSRFAIGDHEMRNFTAEFTQMKTGAFSSWTEAGDLGLTVLSRFIPTFDYANETLYLEPLARPLMISPNHSGMSFSKNGPDAIDILAVRPNSAASAAGVVAGDRIVDVNGKPASELAGSDFYNLVTAPAGTVLQLTIAHRSVTRDIRLVLR